ncbi:glycosyltransferase involved in cell wall biosynthesis [Methylovirgula ligni]|uniref:Glycosyltransferase involved in cell wall biosynthesis n=2 Tax=Methylovirgula ligni TaxID=569860 RepID=A0A3D9Z1R3_9HYPH|nr:glycosyltransferase family 1 protein [Methylovirgula ligni]REF89113.1 glycosyltransferase involved in cell wall biosynthesis [Methylovirgula ligni]
MSSTDLKLRPAASLGSASSKIYIDLSDIVAHSLWHTSCAGIPRVQLEVAAMLTRSSIDVLPFSLYGGIWRNLRPLIEEADDNWDLIFHRLRSKFPYVGVYPSWRRPIQTLLLAKARLAILVERIFSRTPKMTAQSTLFVGGAFWTSSQAMDLCARAVEAGANIVVLVHDLIPITHPEFTGHDFANEFRQILGLPAHFIATTEYNAESLRQVRAELGVRGETQVSVVHLAHEFSGTERNAPAAQPPTERVRPLGALDFALCVGTVEIRKNHMMLFSVWDELVAEYGDNLPLLVVAGSRGWKADAALNRLDELFESGRIVFIEAPNDEELRWLYAACSFTVFPSQFEGWGLPVGESLWFGKPCAASDTSSIPYVGGDLCAYFSPFHATTMKDAIRSLLEPNIRDIYRERIAHAPLRTWADVVTEIGSVIVQQRSESRQVSDGSARCNRGPLQFRGPSATMNR